MKRYPPSPVVLIFAASLLAGGHPLAALADPEMPGGVQVQHSAENAAVTLSWPAVVGQKYRVERSASLGLAAPWEALTGDVEAVKEAMSYVAAPAGDARMFYRLAVAAEDFDPASLGPLWQLDAEKDFPAGAEGQPVSQWTGTGVASAVQPLAARRPVLRNGAVVFDGVDDQISLPMWPQGVGKQWTLSVLMKMHKEVKDFHMPFGGDFAANRVLEVDYKGGGIYRYSPNFSVLVDSMNAAFTGNENWKVLTLRYDGTSMKVSVDWYQGEVVAAAPETGASGNFNLGGGYDAAVTAAPVDIRYMSFFPTCLGDAEVAKMARWMERKKNGEYPPTALFYGSGQSNFYTTLDDLRNQFAVNFDNASFGFGRLYAGRPLVNWMKDRDDGSGYEPTPLYDLSAAPANSQAALQIGYYSGTEVLKDFTARLKTVAKNPRTLTACFFIQGETDAGNATTMWKPNAKGNYHLIYTDPNAWALTYGERAKAWNAAIRQNTGHPEMYFLYERMSYDASRVTEPGQGERIRLQHKSLLDALQSDPRWFLVDTADLPKGDGIHLTQAQFVPAQVPNTGAERFGRSAVRLIKRAEPLSQLPYDARMMAMRLIDAGLAMDAPGFAACAAFAATDHFKDLRSLVIPSLSCANLVEQSALRRTNVVLHLGGLDPVGFVSQAPATTTASATTAAGPDQEALKAAIATFVTTLGGSGEVVVTGE